jgi:hypothetical protein
VSMRPLDEATDVLVGVVTQAFPEERILSVTGRSPAEVVESVAKKNDDPWALPCVIGTYIWVSLFH